MSSIVTTSRVLPVISPKVDSTDKARAAFDKVGLEAVEIIWTIFTRSVGSTPLNGDINYEYLLYHMEEKGYIKRYCYKSKLLQIIPKDLRQKVLSLDSNKQKAYILLLQAVCGIYSNLEKFGFEKNQKDGHTQAIRAVLKLEDVKEVRDSNLVKFVCFMKVQ